MNLKTFLATIRLYWKTFVVVTVAVLAAGAALLVLTPMQYVSTTQLMVSIQGSTTAAAYQNDTVVTGRVNSYIALLTSDVVSQRVIDKLGLPLTASEFAAKVSATNVPPSTSIIDVEVTDSSPEQARRIADALGTEFVNFTNALETPTGEDGQKVRTTVVTAATGPQSQLVEWIGLAVLSAVAALLLGAVAVWIRSRTDRVVRTAEQAAAAAGVPVLGSVTDTLANSLVELGGYRRLRTRLKSTSHGPGGQVVELASVDGNADVLSVASNLGRTMTLTGGRAVVVNATDPHLMEAPKTGPVQGVDGAPDTLAAGSWTAEVVGQLRRDYEQVVIAAPPVLDSLTASVITEYADSVVLLVSAKRTKRRDVRRAADSLVSTGATVTGVLSVDKSTGQTLPKEPSDREKPEPQQQAVQIADLAAGT